MGLFFILASQHVTNEHLVSKSEGFLDNVVCDSGTVIQVLGAWFVDTGGSNTCEKEIARKDAEYFSQIQNKCNERERCEEIEAKVGGKMTCPGTLVVKDTIDEIKVHYRCNSGTFMCAYWLSEQRAV